MTMKRNLQSVGWHKLIALKTEAEVGVDILLCSGQAGADAQKVDLDE